MSLPNNSSETIVLKLRNIRLHDVKITQIAELSMQTIKEALCQQLDVDTGPLSP